MNRFKAYSTLLLAICLIVSGDFDMRPSTARAQENGARRGRDDDGNDERRSRDRRGERSRGEGNDRARRGDSRRARGDDDSRDDGSPSEASSSAEKPAATTPGSGMDMRSYARSLITQHDKDGNKMLSGAELSGLRGAPAQADLNKDGTITSDELVTKLSGPAGSTPVANETAASSSSAKPSSDSSEKTPDPPRSERLGTAARGASEVAGSRTLTNGERKFYRFKTGKDRAPSGLPSYFSRDANGDGQISMREYASSWNDRTAETFRGLDLNGDGIITAKEAVKSK